MAKDTTSNVKKQALDREKISVMQLIAIIYKELLQIDKTNNPMENDMTR